MCKLLITAPSNLFRQLPSISERAKKVSRGPSVKKRLITYERDIILLPSSYGRNFTGKIAIPRGDRDALGAKSLISKITLNSSMSQEEIFHEICAVFKKPMRNNNNFKFTILQPTGGGSKSLTIPALSESFVWTAASLAGKNAKCPIYLLADEELKVNFLT